MPIRVNLLIYPFYSLFSIHRFFSVYSPDPYVTVQILGTPNGVKKTRHVPNTSDPEWNETLDKFNIDPKRDYLIEFVEYFFFKKVLVKNYLYLQFFFSSD